MSILKKTNAPYLVSGALAIGTLLASVVLAVAPYVGFLAPVAALSLGLPFVIVGAVFSAVVIALSAVVINKNNTISEQKAQLVNQTKEIEGKKKENFEQKAQLANQAEGIEGKNKTIFKEEAKVKDQEQRNAELEAQLNQKVTEISNLETQLNERDKKIEKDALKVAIADGVIWFAKGAANGAIWSAKGVINGAWYVGKCTYNNLPPKERLSSSLQSAKDIQRASQEAFVTVKKACSSGRLLGIFKRDLTDAYNAYGTYVSSTWRYVEEKRSTPIGCEDQDVFYDAESGDEEDQDIFYDAESGDEKDTKVSSLKEQLDEKGETNVYNNALDANLLHTQHKNTLTNTPQEEFEISKVEQKKA
ncbi:MAG: hypothetical protein LKM45_03490 [Wolbachia endosymbiont of Alcedoecus sp.]|nr:hypothetical protein [Wolbachia endosymbiont of Alcedoecus sp.]